jgi:hypothetical protein
LGNDEGNAWLRIGVGVDAGRLVINDQLNPDDASPVNGLRLDGDGLPGSEGLSRQRR